MGADGAGKVGEIVGGVFQALESSWKLIVFLIVFSLGGWITAIVFFCLWFFGG